jgi:hypothetical protein
MQCKSRKVRPVTKKSPMKLLLFIVPLIYLYACPYSSDKEASFFNALFSDCTVTTDNLRQHDIGRDSTV